VIISSVNPFDWEQPQTARCHANNNKYKYSETECHTSHNRSHTSLAAVCACECVREAQRRAGRAGRADSGAFCAARSRRGPATAMRKSASPHRFRGASNSSHRSSHTLSLERTTHTTSAVRGTFACTNKRSQSSVRTGCAAPKRIAKPAKHHPARRTRARLRARRSPRRSASSSMSTTSICTSTLCSSSINFEQIAPLQRHDVRASSAALADLRGRQAQHVSERGLMSRAGQVGEACVGAGARLRRVRAPPR